MKGKREKTYETMGRDEIKKRTKYRSHSFKMTLSPATHTHAHTHITSRLIGYADTIISRSAYYRMNIRALCIISHL